MKKFIAVAALFLVCSLNAQTGINTTAPNATLDVRTRNVSSSSPEGILFPQLTGDQLKLKAASFTNAQHGLVTFVTDKVSAPDALTRNITRPGYYRYNNDRNGSYFASMEPTGLYLNTDAGNLGWRLFGQNNNKTTLGFGAIDFSISTTSLSGASGNYAVAFGTNVNASGGYSFAGGSSVNARGGNSFAYGTYAQTNGDNALAIGRIANAGAEGAIALGSVVSASGQYSLASGNGTSASQVSMIALGRYNTVDVLGDGGVFSKNNSSLLKIGNGDSSSSSDAFTVLRNGRAGIDVDKLDQSNTDAKLLVNGKVLVGNFGDSNGGSNEALNVGAGKAQLDVRGDIASSTLADSNNTSPRPVYADSNGVLTTNPAIANPDPLPYNSIGEDYFDYPILLGVNSTDYFPVLIKNITDINTAAAYEFINNNNTWYVRFYRNSTANLVNYEIMWQRTRQ